MKKMLKNVGIVGGGTAAACAACCAIPPLLAPLLAWLGFTGAGLLYSPWLALLMAIPAAMWAVRFLRRRAISRQVGASTCQCESACPTGPEQHSRCR